MYLANIENQFKKLKNNANHKLKYENWFKINKNTKLQRKNNENYVSN